ncbi:hypothetical protein LXL04_002929 [Taraxacum kok-saghyz]
MGDKITWSQEQLKCLLETCIEEVNKVGRKGLSMHKDSWTKLGSVLKERFGMELSQKQMKNCYDNLKAKYVGWAYLKNKTGNLYNPQTNMFNLTMEECDDSKKGHPKAAVLKTHPLPHPELCAALFDGSSATGNLKWTSTQSTQPTQPVQTISGSSSCRVQPLELMSTPFVAMYDDDGTSYPSPNAPSSNVDFNTRSKRFTRHNRRLRRVFKGAVGTLDGTLIHAVVPVRKQDLYRGRGKGDCYQNVLAICDFNMIFTFVVAGWEGISHDSRILSEALSDPDAPFPLPPPDKYYLCDAAYAHIRGFMAPYRNVRYWLGDFRRRRALNNKEKFNHAHAKLRNVIERAYGVLKARFPILKRMAPFSKEGLNDEYFARYEEPNVTCPNNNEPVDDAEVETADVWTTSSSAELCRCGPQIADVLALKKQTEPKRDCLTIWMMCSAARTRVLSRSAAQATQRASDDDLSIGDHRRPPATQRANDDDLHSCIPARRPVTQRPYELLHLERKEYMHRLVYESDDTCLQQLRMNRTAFVKLCRMLEIDGKLKASRYLQIDEQVAIFLHVLAHHVKNRVVKFQFRRSGETVSKHFNNVVNAVIRLERKLFKKPEPISETSTDERWKWFKGCLGAIDVTHISVHVSEKDIPRYRNRKGEITTNVLAACTPDMQFIYVLPGWEGSAADGRILRSAMLRENGLQVSKGMTSQPPSDRGPGKNKRKWNDIEDEKLVEAMVDILNSGSHFKSDIGFKPGFFGAVETRLAVSLPNSGIKAKPHIESRIKTLKSDWSAVHDMMSWNNTSGLGWDSENKMLEAPQSVWQAYAQVHKNAAKWRGKKFPYYWDLCFVFEKDRANGRDAQTAADIIFEMTNEQEEPINNTQGSGDGLDDIGVDVPQNTPTETPIIEESIFGIERDREELRKKLNSEMKRVVGLTVRERNKAVRMLSKNEELMVIFFTVEDEDKYGWIIDLLEDEV